MSMIKKLIALTLALAMVLSVAAFAGNYSAEVYADADKIDGDCKKAIELLYALNIMKGDTQGNFNPEATVRRAEVAKMIYVILNYGEDDGAVNYTGAKFFSDVEAGAWYEGYVNYAASIKLVQGRPDGTFGPNDPVTCAEAAKMLLTAIGYSAEARGYTGAKWADNVLSDAAIIKLLKGYDYNTQTYAPRQWVAVMFKNALIEAYTFGTMIPSFSGLLTSGYDKPEDYETMGEKYFNLDTFTGYAVATKTVALEGQPTGSTGKVRFDDGDGETLTVKGSGLETADLGEQYYVIYDTETKAVYSVSNTGKSVVAEGLAEDVEKDLVYGTGAITDEDTAQGKNHFEYTVDGTTLALEGTIRVLTNKDAYLDETIVATAETDEVDAMDDIIDDASKTTNLIKVIDRNNDGEIDYVIETVYEYAKVTKVSSYSYGDYVWMQFADKNNAVKYYVEDSIITEDELVKGNVVKVTVDFDSKMYVVEVLSGETDVTCTKIKSNKYTIGGETYRIAKNGFGATISLKDDLDIIYDGDLIVYEGEHKTYVEDLDALNDLLCVVTNTSNHYVFNNVGGYNAVKVLTIDGNEEWIRYADQNASKADMDALEGHLFRLKIKSNGDAELLDYATIDNCEVAEAAAPIATGTLKASESKTTFRKDTKSELMYVDTEATFFLYDTDEEEYLIGTVGELGLGSDAAAAFEGFVNTDEDWTYIVAGLIKGDPSGAASKGKGYALTTSAVYDVYDEEEDETYKMVDVMFPGDEESTAVIVDVDASDVITNKTLYYYSYVGSKYTLTDIAWTGEWDDNSAKDDPADYATGRYEIYNVDGTDFTAYFEGDRYDIWEIDEDGADILVKVVTWTAAEEDGTRDIDSVTFDFVEELDGDAIDAKYDGNTKYWSDFSAIYEKENEDWDRSYSLLYVTIYVVEDYVTEGEF